MAKDVVAQKFELKTPLYFSYTHLVCRTALEGEGGRGEGGREGGRSLQLPNLSGFQDGREDLSHPVHSDNCILNEATGDCDKIPPAYTWRDYR